MNTTPNDNLITGFVFNINGNATATLTPDPTATFTNLTGPITAAPFGDFEAGAAIGGDWEGGGNPNTGIAAGAMQTFAFDVTGPDAATLTANSFFSELSTNPGGGGAQVFVVRFRGGTVESDKVPGVPGSNPVPLPAAAWSDISMLGALGLSALKRKIKLA